ncbi:MAG: flippase-like domain-containing protein [Methanothrix sp.]|nr:flippase-like domain-containing protein [Methanothrix sp.]
MSKKQSAARFFIGLLLIASLLYRFDPEVVFSTIISAKLNYLFLAAVVYSITFFILSSRWRMILHRMGVHLSIVPAYQAFAGGMIISDMTPGRIGELARPLLVRDKIDLNRGIASVAIDRYADILTTFILGLSGMLLLAQQGSHLILASLVILVILFSSSAFWFKRHFILKQVDRLGSSRLTEIVRALDNSLHEVTNIKELMLRSVLLTAVAWIFHALRIALIAKSVGFDVPLQMLFLLQPLVSSLALVPITVSGLGLVEGGLAAILHGLGVPVAAGISIALMDRAITVAFHILIGGQCAMKVL